MTTSQGSAPTAEGDRYTAKQHAALYAVRLAWARSKKADMLADHERMVLDATLARACDIGVLWPDLQEASGGISWSMLGRKIKRARAARVRRRDEEFAARLMSA